MGQKRGAARARRRAATATPRRRGLPIAALAAIIALAGGLAYSPSFDGVFVADDEDAIVRNESIRSLTTALVPPRETTAAGRPVLNLSFALNYAIGGADPWGYHAVNLAIHLCAAVALFGDVRRTLTAPALSPRFGAAATPLAFAVALLWVVHPLTTPAVTYVVQRAESLAGLLFLLTMYAALRVPEGGGRAVWWACASIAACALGMATKEVMVVAPLVVALWLWILYPEVPPFDRRQRTLLGGLACTWIMLAALVATTPRGESVGFTIGGWTPLSYVRTQAEVVVHYLRLAVYPDPLVFMYSWPPASWRGIVPEFLLVATLGAVTLVLTMRRHAAALPGLWFFLILAPSSSLLPIATEVAAEHRMYLPLAAVIAVIVVACASVARLRPAIGGAVVCALALGATTHARNQDYHSIEGLMRDTVENSPSNLRARVIYGGHLLGLERYSDAEAQLRVATTLPERVAAEQGLVATAHMYLGSSLAGQGKLDEAIPHLRKALELSPALSETHALLGEAYAGQGRLEESASSFARAVELMPDVGPVLMRAADVAELLSQQQARAGNPEEARLTYERALEWRRRARK